MFAFVTFTIVREHGGGGQITVQRYVALVYTQAMCLRCVCVVLEALLAWRGVPVAERFSWFPSLPPLSWVRVSPSFSVFVVVFVFSLFRGFVHFISTGLLASV